MSNHYFLCLLCVSYSF
uniref:Uncharacterized protein n=1 Tax=Arabidopsis thaliana TaxID=3702 RepID=Q0WMK0_ARATH|nr:hypothetical protein [Arabidopsis thaliana]